MYCYELIVLRMHKLDGYLLLVFSSSFLSYFYQSCLLGTKKATFFFDFIPNVQLSKDRGKLECKAIKFSHSKLSQCYI